MMIGFSHFVPVHMICLFEILGISHFGFEGRILFLILSVPGSRLESQLTI